MPADALRFLSHARPSPASLEYNPRVCLALSGRNLPETDLIREAQAGSRTAFDALVRQYDQAVLRLAIASEPVPNRVRAGRPAGGVPQGNCYLGQTSVRVARFIRGCYRIVHQTSVSIICAGANRGGKIRRW